MSLALYTCRVPGGCDIAGPGQVPVHYGITSDTPVGLVPQLQIPNLGVPPSSANAITVSCTVGVQVSAWYLWAPGTTDQVSWQSTAGGPTTTQDLDTREDRCANLWMNQGLAHFSVT